MRLISWPRLVISAALALLSLSFHNLWSIKADNNIFESTGLFLTIVQLFIFSTLSYFIYKALGGFKNSHKRIKLIIAALIFIACWFYFLIYHLSPSYDFYVVYGDVLAHRYGINWFWMDWGVWVFCITTYLLGLYLYLVNQVLNILPEAKSKKKKD